MTQTAEKPADGKHVQEDQPGYLDNRAQFRGDANRVAEVFSHYPPEIRDDGIWLWFFVKTKCNGEHAILARIARSLGLKDRGGKEPSDQYWYQVAGGHYFKPAGDTGSFKRYVLAIRAYARQREEGGSISHVETTNWKLFSDYVESRRSFSMSCRVGAIEGLSGSQKTQCGKHYAALHNHLETVHIEAPGRCTRARLVHKLAASYLVSESKSIGEKELAIERFLRGATVINPDSPAPNRPRCVILDNVQRLYRPNVPPDQQPIFNYLHELQDDTGFCLIFTWVPTFRNIISGKDPFWAQFLGRIGGVDEILSLDQALPKRDIVNIAREFRVDDDAAAFPILKRWASTIWGIRPLIFKLEKARVLATKNRSPEIRVSHLKAEDLEPTPEFLEET